MNEIALGQQVSKFVDQTSLLHDFAGGAVSAYVGHLAPPLAETLVQMPEIVERGTEEEVCTDVTERAFDFTLGLEMS